MNDVLKEKLKELAKKDKIRFMNAIAYYILSEQLEKDEELKRMVYFIQGLTDVDLNELLKDVVEKAITEKPNIVNLGLGIAMTIGYISNRIRRR